MLHFKVQNQGFTLIEVLIYLGLFAIIIGGAFVSVYYLIDGHARTATRITAQEEGNFLLRKIDWALTAATAINQPLPGTTGSLLSLTVSGLPATDNPLVFSLAGRAMQLRRGNASPVKLSTPNVSIASLQATHIAAVGGKPAGVSVSFRINNQTFHLTKYLRQ